MSKRVIIQEEECIGCGSCVELCPDVFEFDEDSGKAVVILPEDGPADCIEDAIAECPVECIYWEEDEEEGFESEDD